MVEGDTMGKRSASEVGGDKFAAENENEHEDAETVETTDTESFVDTGGSMLLLGAPNVGKSTLLRRLHRTTRLSYRASMHKSALLDGVAAKTCREDILAFCRGPVAAAPSTPLAYDRQVIIDDVDTLPKPVQQILAALIDQYRPATCLATGRCRFIFSCASLTKVQTALQTRLACVQLLPLPPATLERMAQTRARERGLVFSPDLWARFCAQYCGAAVVNPRAAFAALHRLSLLAEHAKKEERDGTSNVRAGWLHDPRHDAFDALLRDASRTSVVEAYQVVREIHGLAPADLLDAMFVHVRDRAEWMDPERRFRWYELLGRAMRGLPPSIVAGTGDEVPWFSVLVAAEKSLL